MISTINAIKKHSQKLTLSKLIH